MIYHHSYASPWAGSQNCARKIIDPGRWPWWRESWQHMVDSRSEGMYSDVNDLVKTGTPWWLDCVTDHQSVCKPVNLTLCCQIKPYSFIRKYLANKHNFWFFSNFSHTSQTKPLFYTLNLSHDHKSLQKYLTEQTFFFSVVAWHILFY